MVNKREIIKRIESSLQATKSEVPEEQYQAWLESHRVVDELVRGRRVSHPVLSEGEVRALWVEFRHGVVPKSRQEQQISDVAGQAVKKIGYSVEDEKGLPRGTLDKIDEIWLRDED
jgi:hypothetical protein